MLSPRGSVSRCARRIPAISSGRDRDEQVDQINREPEADHRGELVHGDVVALQRARGRLRRPDAAQLRVPVPRAHRRDRREQPFQLAPLLGRGVASPEARSSRIRSIFAGSGFAWKLVYAGCRRSTRESRRQPAAPGPVPSPPASAGSSPRPPARRSRVSGDRRRASSVTGSLTAALAPEDAGRLVPVRLDRLLEIDPLAMAGEIDPARRIRHIRVVHAPQAVPDQHGHDDHDPHEPASRDDRGLARR